MVYLDKEHGVNPTIPRCFFCGEHKNELILAGRMKGGIEAPRDVVWDTSPCDECADFMKQGVILISVRDGEVSKVQGDLEKARAQYSRKYGSSSENMRKRNPFRYIPNPFRTGGFVVVRGEMFVGRDDILEARYAFVEDADWLKMGLPKEEVTHE